MPAVKRGRRVEEQRVHLRGRDWNYRHQTAGMENAGPSSYEKPKHVVVTENHRDQIFVGINNVAYAFILVACTFP